MQFRREVFFVLLLCFNRAHFQSKNGRLEDSRETPLSSNKSPNTPQVPEPETYITTTPTSPETTIERSPDQSAINQITPERTLEEPFIKRRLKQINAQKPSAEKLVSFLQLGDLALPLPKENQTEQTDPNSKTKPSAVKSGVQVELTNREREGDENLAQTNKPRAKLDEVPEMKRKQRSSRQQKADCPLPVYLKDSDEDHSAEDLESFREETEEGILKLQDKGIGIISDDLPLVVVINPDSRRQKKRVGRRNYSKKSNKISSIDTEDDERKISLKQLTMLMNKLIDSYQCCNREDQGVVENIKISSILGKQKRETSPDQAPQDNFFPIQPRLTLAKLGAALEQILKGPPNDQTADSNGVPKKLNLQEDAAEMIKGTKIPEAGNQSQPIALESRLAENFYSATVGESKSKWRKRWSDRDQAREVSLSDGDLLRFSINRRVTPDKNDTGKLPVPGMDIIKQVVDKIIALVSKFVKKFLTTLIRKLYTAGLDGRLTLYIALSILFGLIAGIAFGGAMAVGMGVIQMCKHAPGSNFPTKFFNIVTWPIKYFFGDIPTLVDKLDFVAIFNRLLDTLKDIYKAIVL